MAKVSIYLNFPRSTEAAFTFYKGIFGGEYMGGIMRYADSPPCEGAPKLSTEDQRLVMHVALPILGGFMLLGSDAPEAMGFKTNVGNNFYINLEPDTREEGDRLFAALSAGGKVEMKMQEMFWGAYWGSLKDKFGVQWMVNVANKK